MRHIHAPSPPAQCAPASSAQFHDQHYAAALGHGNAVLIILGGPGSLRRRRRLSTIVDAWAGCNLFLGTQLNQPLASFTMSYHTHAPCLQTSIRGCLCLHAPQHTTTHVLTTRVHATHHPIARCPSLAGLAAAAYTLSTPPQRQAALISDPPSRPLAAAPTTAQAAVHAGLWKSPTCNVPHSRL